MKQTKVMLCCIGRLENPYIREFVEYYKNLGVTNICLYDNNYDGEEDFRDVIGDYIDSGYVILKDCRNKKDKQPIVYEYCYNMYCDNYDWFCFFDCDEFFHLEHHENIQDFLNQDVFRGHNAIVTSWKIYDDNDLLYYTNEPLQKRFTRECNTEQYHDFWKYFVKTIVRGKLGTRLWWERTSSHFPQALSYGNFNPCDVNGNPIKWKNEVRSMEPVYDTAYLKHYELKTIEEFCKIKAKRGWADNSDCYLTVEYFFEKNKHTPLKEGVGRFFISQNTKGIKIK